MRIRMLQQQDNPIIARIIRDCLIEFGGNREGLAWQDDSLDDLYSYYLPEGRAYWVIEHQGEIVGGCGIAPFAESKTICELQKMYLLPTVRGTGIATDLWHAAADYAKEHYDECYLETLQTMEGANRFYQKHGFIALASPLAGSEHFACDAWYILKLR